MICSCCHFDTGKGPHRSRGGFPGSWESVVMLSEGAEAQMSLADHSRVAFFSNCCIS